jgi:hypothetical protein
MKNVLIRDLDDSLVESFKLEAKRRGTSLQAVLKQTLNDNRPKALNKKELLEALDALRASSPRTSNAPTGLELIQEGRRERDERLARILNW